MREVFTHRFSLPGKRGTIASVPCTFIDGEPYYALSVAKRIEQIIQEAGPGIHTLTYTEETS